MKHSDILLLLSPVSLDEDKKIFPTYFPYFSLTCATHLKKADFQVKIIDYYQNFKEKIDIIKEIKKNNPKLIGFCISEPTRYLPFDTHITFINFINSISKVPIFIFGLYQTWNLEQYAQNNYIDHILYGDPEHSIVHLAKEQLIEHSKEIPRILGFKSQNNILPLKINNLNEILPIDYSFIDSHQYKFNPHRYKNSTLHHMIISRGCPWNKCTFCEDMSLLKMPPYRYKSAEAVIEEIEYIYKKNHSFEIQFYDPQFITDIDWLTEFSQLIDQKNLSFKWSCLSRADNLNEQVLKLMSQAGCWNIIIGIESFSEHLLKEINKGISNPQVIQAIKLCKKHKIEVTGSFLLGLPNEVPADVINSSKQAIKLDLDYVQFFIAKYSDNHQLVHKKKYQVSHQIDYSQFDFIGTPLILKNYRDLDHLKQTQKKAYRVFYFNYKTILKIIKKINSFKDVLRIFKGLIILLKISSNKSLK